MRGTSPFSVFVSERRPSQPRRRRSHAARLALRSAGTPSRVTWSGSRQGPWFQWHGDRFTIPAGATELARSPIGPQAFRAGRSVGVQFHPEVDVTIVADWLDGRSAGEADFAAAAADPAAIIDAAAAMAEAAAPNLHRLIDEVLR